MPENSPTSRVEHPDDGEPDFDRLYLVRDGEDDTYRWLTPRLAARLWLGLELIADEHSLGTPAYDDRLPAVALNRGEQFAARISRAAVELRDDIARGEPPFPRCTGESVVLGWALQDARDTASGDDETTAEIARQLLDPLALTDEDSAAPASDLHGLYDELFQDLDFEVLYNLELDGIDASEAGQQLGMESLRPDDWFIPYRNVDHLSPRPHTNE